MNRWWRFDNDAHNNPKLLRLSDEMFRAWTVLLSLASKNGGALPPADDIALTLRMKPTKIAEWITRLTKAGLLDNDDGVFSPHNWKTRQYVSDDSTERVRKHRKNKKRNGDDETKCNVSSSVTETVSVTPPEQKQSRTDSEQSRADAGAPIDEDLKRRAQAIGAGISAHFLSRHLAIPNLERCQHWLSQGYAQGTILAAVEAVLKRPGAKPATLEYFDGAIRDAHAKAAPQISGTLVEATNKVFVEVGTPEWNAHMHARGGRSCPITQHRVGHVLKDGWWFEKPIPDGYDEATGEKLETAGEERVA